MITQLSLKYKRFFNRIREKLATRHARMVRPIRYLSEHHARRNSVCDSFFCFYLELLGEWTH